MNDCVKKGFIFCLFNFFVYAVLGCEKWCEEREKILDKFVELNRKLKGQDEKIESFKIEVKKLMEQNENRIEEIKKSLITKDERIDHHLPHWIFPSCGALHEPSLPS